MRFIPKAGPDRNHLGGSAVSVADKPARDLALIAIFAGIVAALGVVPALQPPGFTVPITAQTLGVMLAGAVLGARRGGLAVFFGPSVGFLLAWPVSAFVIGWITERGGPRYRLSWGLAANLVGGIVVLYAFGIAGIAAVSGLSVWAATVSTWIFVPGDLVKAVLAAVVARGVHAAYPGLIGAGSRAGRVASHR